MVEFNESKLLGRGNILTKQQEEMDSGSVEY
jgi:hypothetical protein